MQSISIFSEPLIRFHSTTNNAMLGSNYLVFVLDCILNLQDSTASTSATLQEALYANVSALVPSFMSLQYFGMNN